LQACGQQLRAAYPDKRAFRDPFTGQTIYVVPSTSTCPEPTCKDGTAYHPDYGLIPCPVCNAKACPKCGGTGMYVPPLPSDNVNFGKPIFCPEKCEASQRLQQDYVAKLYAGSALPEGYQDCTLDSFLALVQADDAPAGEERWRGKLLAFEAVSAFIANAASEALPFGVDYAAVVSAAEPQAARDLLPGDVRNSLVLHGPHGTGKTGFAAAIVNALVSAGYAVRYIRTQDFIKAVQDRYGENWRDNPPDDEFGDLESGRVIDVVRKAPVLILDEFDMPDAARENKQSIIENVVRYRMNYRMPTVITTNLDYGALETRWGTTTMVVLGQRAHFIAVGGPVLRVTPQAIQGVL
jgi:DNA replication protein DnaC